MLCKSPLKWPPNMPRTPSRKEALFRSGKAALSTSAALQRLEEELRRLGVTDSDSQVILLTNMKPGARGMTIPIQGEPGDTGVVAHWDVNGKERTMAIDIYDRTADNIAAIAEVLKYLRGVERHGGAAVQEQAFAGFDALPPPDDCWKILAIEKSVARLKLPDLRKQYVMDSFRIAAREGHGNGVDMDRLVKARDEALKQLGVT